MRRYTTAEVTPCVFQENCDKQFSVKDPVDECRIFAGVVSYLLRLIKRGRLDADDLAQNASRDNFVVPELQQHHAQSPSIGVSISTASTSTPSSLMGGVSGGTTTENRLFSCTSSTSGSGSERERQQQNNKRGRGAPSTSNQDTFGGRYALQGRTFEGQFSAQLQSMEQTATAATEDSQKREWLLHTTQSCCFSMTSIVAGLIYLTRLLEEKRLAFGEKSWQAIWCCIMILSEKYWEDNYIHPGHVLNTFGFGSGKRMMLRMQMWLLGALRWSLTVPEPDYERMLHKLREEGTSFIQSRNAGEPPSNLSVLVERPLPKSAGIDAQKLREPPPDMPLPQQPHVATRMQLHAQQQLLQYHLPAVGAGMVHGGGTSGFAGGGPKAHNQHGGQNSLQSVAGQPQGVGAGFGHNGNQSHSHFAIFNKRLYPEQQPPRAPYFVSNQSQEQAQQHLQHSGYGQKGANANGAPGGGGGSGVGNFTNTSHPYFRDQSQMQLHPHTGQSQGTLQQQHQTFPLNTQNYPPNDQHMHFSSHSSFPSQQGHGHYNLMSNYPNNALSNGLHHAPFPFLPHGAVNNLSAATAAQHSLYNEYMNPHIAGALNSAHSSGAAAQSHMHQAAYDPNAQSFYPGGVGSHANNKMYYGAGGVGSNPAGTIMNTNGGAGTGAGFNVALFNHANNRGRAFKPRSRPTTSHSYFEHNG
ncbi:unnamed protein product [Amoebophrya sp. A120]|nr:unnamed protein product [Amoebophrya sp. A120]|eukprot:GSA120T00011576001.1